MTGTHEKKIVLNDQYFGEGITILNNKLYQLTWKSRIGFVYDLRSFEKIKEFKLPNDGWGITHNGTNLIVSDGSNKLTFLDTVYLKKIREVYVHHNSSPIDRINELEFIDGYIYSNRWMTNEILKIDLVSGNVVGRLDLTNIVSLVKQRSSSADVLNGIAYERKSGLLLITGKFWPFLFVIKLKKE